MKTFGGKLVNHELFHDLGQKLETAGKIAGTVHTIYNTAKFLQPYVAGALRISSLIEMFHKGVSMQTRMFDLKCHAFAAGRGIIGKLEYTYHTGRHVFNAVDRGYNIFKKIHSALQPALMDQAPGLAKAAKQAMGSYESTRKAVMGADAVGQRIGAAVRREMAY